MKKLIIFYNLLNSIYKNDLNSCANLIISSIQSSKKTILTCLNPHSFYLLNNDIKFYNSVLNSDILIPDGIGVIYASKLLNLSIQERITGPDLFYTIMNILNKEKGFSVFFLGSNSDTLLKINERFKSDYKNIELVGHYSPPFKDSFSDEESSSMIDAINKVSPDILWIGMTQPKQEKWIYDNKNKLNIKFAAGIGAHFDYYSGNIEKPKNIFLLLNLQWLHRFFQNPKKMWRRNFISTPFFIFIILVITFFLYFKKLKYIKVSNTDLNQ